LAARRTGALHDGGYLDLRLNSWLKKLGRRILTFPPLAGTKKAKPSTNAYVTMGGEDEATHCVDDWGFDWPTTPGAVDWLREIAAEMASIETESRAAH
jgi:hypothetical protein